MSMPRDDSGRGVDDADENGVFDCGCMFQVVGRGFSLRRCRLHAAAPLLLKAVRYTREILRAGTHTADKCEACDRVDAAIGAALAAVDTAATPKGA